jgi:hypothetical protein
MPVSRNKQYEQAAGWFHVRRHNRLLLCDRTHDVQGHAEGPLATLGQGCGRGMSFGPGRRCIWGTRGCWTSCEWMIGSLWYSFPCGARKCINTGERGLDALSVPPSYHTSHAVLTPSDIRFKTCVADVFLRFFPTPAFYGADGVRVPPLAIFLLRLKTDDRSHQLKYPSSHKQW